MSLTFSIYDGQNIETSRKVDINSVLNDLPDNTSKLISPRDVRDAFFTTWANIPFKQTKGLNTSEYIGIDSGNPNNRDLKYKILIGKRSNGGFDIINNNLINNNDSDIFIYNTKVDSASQSSTKISILSGTNSTLHQNSPFIESESNSNGIKLNLVNPSYFNGSINLISYTGRVSINDVVFPTILESASASNGQILKYYGTYPYGVLKWSNADVSVSNVGSSASITNLFGDVTFNGSPLEFSDSNQVPVTLGGITAGSSFPSGTYNGNDYPLVEMIRRILYPYIAPELTLDITPTYLEKYKSNILNFNYSIKRLSENIVDYNITGTTYSNLSYSASPQDTLNVSFTHIQSYTIGATTQSYTLRASDSIIGSYTHSVTSSVYYVDPIFATFSPSILSNLNTMNTTQNNKIIKPYPGLSQSIDANVSGTGYLYFIYPSSYGNLKYIKDFNGFVIHDYNNNSISAFTYSVMSNTNYNSIGYYVYRTKNICSYIGNYEFKFIF